MKIKIALRYPFWKFNTWRAKRINKKSKKDPEKYEPQWKFDFVVKKATKMLKILNIVIEVKGYENLPKGVALLTPNHQSNIDALALIVALKKQTHDAEVENKMCLFLAKEEIKKNKSFKIWADFLESAYIDRKNPKTALVALDQLAKKAKIQNKYIVIFPEGTRSKDGEIKEFIPGAFRIAKKEFIPIVPVTINNTFAFSDLSRKGKLKVTIIFHKLIKPSSLMTKQTHFIAKKTQQIVKGKWEKPQPHSNKKKKDKLNG